MESEEKLWAKTLLTAYTYLDEAAFEADRRLMDEALYSWRSPRSAEGVCRQLMQIVAVKEGYINAKVITKQCLDDIADKYRRALVCRYIKKYTYTVIAQVAKVSERSVYNHMLRAIDAFALALKKRGYDAKRMKEMFDGNSFIMGVYRRIK